MRGGGGSPREKKGRQAEGLGGVLDGERRAQRQPEA